MDVDPGSRRPGNDRVLVGAGREFEDEVQAGGDAADPRRGQRRLEGLEEDLALLAVALPARTTTSGARPCRLPAGPRS